MTSLYSEKGSKRPRPSGNTGSAATLPRKAKAARTLGGSDTAGGAPSGAAEEEQPSTTEDGQPSVVVEQPEVAEGAQSSAIEGDNSRVDPEPIPSSKRCNTTTHFRADNTRRRSGRRRGEQEPPGEPVPKPKPQPAAPRPNPPASAVATRWDTEMGGMSLDHVDIFMDICNSLSSALGRRLLFMRTPDSDLVSEVNCQLGKVRFHLFSSKCGWFDNDLSNLALQYPPGV